MYKKDKMVLQRAKFCKWIAERMIPKINTSIDNYGNPRPLYDECLTLISISNEVITDFKRFNQTTEEKAEQISRLWEIYGTVPEVA